MQLSRRRSNTEINRDVSAVALFAFERREDFGQCAIGLFCEVPVAGGVVDRQHQKRWSRADCKMQRLTATTDLRRTERCINCAASSAKATSVFASFLHTTFGFGDRNFGPTSHAARTKDRRREFH